MDDDHEQSLVAWANTFTSAEDSPPALATAGAASLSDFASGDSLLPIARTIVGHEDDSSDGTTSRNDSAAADSWVEVFSIVKSAELIDSDAAAPGTDEGQEEKLAAAVTCLEALLRYTVGEECSGRERFIHQIMSLDHAVQTTLRHIIIGTHHQTQCETASEATSPSRESDFGGNECTAAVPMSPAPSTYSMISSPSDRRLSPADFSSEEDVGQADDLSFKSWFSPQTSASARKVRMDRARSSGRAAPVGPRKRQHGTHLNMDTATDTVVQEEEATTRAVALTGVTDVISGSGALAPAGSAASATSAEEVAHLRREIDRLSVELEDTETARAQSISAVEAERDAAIAREAELSEDLRNVQLAAERVACSGEDDVIAVEKAMRAKHEQEVAGLHDRASKADERLCHLEHVEDEVVRLRDEVDVLRPAESKLVKLEANLARCRDRIEELSDLPSQLKREEDARAEVLDRCLALETEVAQVPALRRQLDVYRRSQTDMEMENREKSRELKLAQEEVSRLSHEVQILADGSGAVRNEHHKLQEELNRRTLKEAEGGGDSGGIGQGMSELNPVLSEELARLRRQNEQLAAKVDYNTVETIQDLERKADDANRLADTFHDNLASERKIRATAESSLADARARIVELEAEIAALREEHRDTVSRLEADAAASAAAAAAALVTSHKEAREALQAAENLAAEALEAERTTGEETLAAAERNCEMRMEGLREEMAVASEAAIAAAAAVADERKIEREGFQSEITTGEETALREAERVQTQIAEIEEAHALEKRQMEEEIERQEAEAHSKAEETAEESVAARRAFESEIGCVRKELEQALEDAKCKAASELAGSRGETAKEAEGRLEEARQKDEAVQEVERLEAALSAGKSSALTAIDRLKSNASELRQEAAWLRRQDQEEFDSKLAALTDEFEKYREAHTVDDLSYHKDMDEWEGAISTQRKLVAELRGQADALKKDKRRLEREKTYYWGQAEELRISAAAGGRTDPANGADYAQLVEHTKELVEENRQLRQRAQESDDSGVGDGSSGVSTRSRGRWGGSGVAAMRAEHEAEVTALKEEKQDMLLKYHATSSKLNEHERRCIDMGDEMERMQSQVVQLQLECKRQEKRLVDSTALPASLNKGGPSSQKENQPLKQTPSKKSVSRKLRPAGNIPLDGDDSDQSRVLRQASTEPSATARERGSAKHTKALRGLGDVRPEEELKKIRTRKQAVKNAGEVGETEETPPECKQS